MLFLIALLCKSLYVYMITLTGEGGCTIYYLLLCCQVDVQSITCCLAASWMYNLLPAALLPHTTAYPAQYRFRFLTILPLILDRFTLTPFCIVFCIGAF